LPGLAHRLPAQLSGGQQQRVAVARALVFEPQLILMDEPLGALDKQLRDEMQLELRGLHERLGITTVYVTHDQSEALTMSDRIAVFHHGRIQQIADPRNIYNNPVNGFVVNANNDPAGVTLNNNPVDQLRRGGQGIYYLGYAFDYGTRAGRITQALQQRFAKGPVDRTDMQAIQADVKLLDAEVLTPYITGAFQRASKPGAHPALAALAGDPRIAEAVGRLRSWNHTTPTGVPTGYDASDKDGNLKPPSAAEVKRSVAATIYSVWRGKAIANGVDLTLQGLGVPTPGSGEAIKALRHLMERSGIGLSTVDFFGWAPLPTAAERRDYVALESLKDALDALAGPDFQAAFKGSTNQEDYKWGRLHRIVFDGLVVGGPFSIPGATPGLPPSFPDLSGIATDGGFGVVDASSHSARAGSSGAFMFGSGPNRRYVGTPGTAPGTIAAETSLPGGISGSLTSPFYANLLRLWLTNDTFPLRQSLVDVMQNLNNTIVFNP